MVEGSGPPAGRVVVGSVSSASVRVSGVVLVVLSSSLVVGTELLVRGVPSEVVPSAPSVVGGGCSAPVVGRSVLVIVRAAGVDLGVSVVVGDGSITTGKKTKPGT